MASAQTAIARQLHRRPDRRVFGGVCAGVADYLGVEPLIVRAIAMVFAAVGGIGVGLYALAWALMPVAPGRPKVKRSRSDLTRAGLLAALVAAAITGIHRAGLLIGTWQVPMLVLGVCGMALVWRPAVWPGGGAASRRRLTLRECLRHPSEIDGPRVLAGSLLVAFASASLLHTAGVLHSLGAAIGAVAIVATALALLFGPWFLRLGRSLSFERAARIREQERAEVAAHLHDSVLQTLALIQNRASDAQEVATLARRQERELRRWLFERPRAGAEAGQSVKGALQRAAAEIEELHGVPIEVVVVGDGPLDARVDAVVQAAREAMVNASKFAGSGRVDLYAEVGEQRVEVFVRDRGAGFDPDRIPADRRGVRESIVGRMVRNGGHCAIHSEAGLGTEVELAIELTA